MYRNKDSNDGTAQDIFHLCSALERLFLYHPPDRTPCVQLLNYFELLFQSARTRVCVFFEPENGVLVTEKTVQDLMVVTTFRSCAMYKLFIEHLTAKLQEDKKQFLDSDCVSLNEAEGGLYFILVRVNPHDKDLSLERHHSNESYFRLSSLFRKLEEDKAHWGLNIKRAMFNCLSHMHQNSRWACARPLLEDSGNVPIQPFPLNEEYSVDRKISARNKKAVLDRLKALKYWIADVYELLEEMPLTAVVNPNDSKQELPFHNVFFFQRINVLDEGEDCVDGCNTFEIRNIVPPRQRQQFSTYYHENQADTCEYYQHGQCGLSGMGTCIIKPYWDSAEQHFSTEEVFAHYGELWEQMEKLSPASSGGVSAAFESRSVVFDRRHECVTESGERCRVRPDDRRNQLTACLSHRIMQADDKVSGDSFPQVLYVPLYAGSEPLMAIATVINAAQPVDGDVALSEWRRAFRFADYALGRLSERLQESLRRIYMNEAVDLLHDRFTQSKLLVQENPSNTLTEQQYESKLLRLVQNDFNLLALTLPFRKILLAMHTQSVIKRQLQCGIFTTAWRNEWQVSLEKNPYWRFGSDHDGLDLDYVVKKFSSCMLRATAYREREKCDLRRFLVWYIDKFGREYQQKIDLNLNWRREAHRLGWPDNDDES